MQVVATVLEEKIYHEKGYATYRLDDGTYGRPVSAKIFSSSRGAIESVAEAGLDDFRMQASLRYISLIGYIDQYRGVNAINAEAIRIVSDSHEPFHHILNVIQTELCYQRGPPVCKSIWVLSHNVHQAVVNSLSQCCKGCP